MMLEPREPAAAESYPTFWDELPALTPRTSNPLTMHTARS